MKSTGKCLVIVVAMALAFYAVNGWLSIEGNAAAQAQRSERPIEDAVLRYLQEERLNYTRVRDGVYRIQYSDVNFSTRFVVYEEMDRLMVLAQMDEKVPASHRPAVIEYLTRINYGLIIGNFEMDLSDGEVQFRVSVDVEHVGINTKKIGQMLGIAIHNADRFAPGIEELSKGRTPEDIYNEIIRRRD